MGTGSRERHGRSIRRPIQSPLLEAGATRAANAEQVVTQLMFRLRSNHPQLLSDVSWQVMDIPEEQHLKQPIPEFRVDRAERKIVIYRIPILRASSALIEPRWAIESRVYVALARLVEKSPGYLRRKPRSNEPRP
jgi:hypothetical protein